MGEDAKPPFDTGTVYRLVFELRPGDDGLGFDAIFVDGDGQMVLTSGVWRQAVSIEALDSPPYEYAAELVRDDGVRRTTGPRGMHQLHGPLAKPGSVLMRRRIGSVQWEAAPGAGDGGAR